MRKWPDDYDPIFDVDVTVDDTTIDEEPFQPPTEAAVYALQMRHLIDDAVSYTQFARDRNHQQTAEQTAETAPWEWRDTPPSTATARTPRMRLQAITTAINMQALETYPKAERYNRPRSGGDHPPSSDKGSWFETSTPCRRGSSVPLSRRVPQIVFTPRRRGSSNDARNAGDVGNVAPAQAGILHKTVVWHGRGPS